MIQHLLSIFLKNVPVGCKHLSTYLLKLNVIIPKCYKSRIEYFVLTNQHLFFLISSDSDKSYAKYRGDHENFKE